MAIDRYLRRTRLDAGLTQAEVAKALGTDQSAVSGWETGKTRPSGPSLINLADLFGCSVDALLGREAANP